MYCPDCGTYVDSNFCINCGKDMRSVLIKTAEHNQSNTLYYEHKVKRTPSSAKQNDIGKKAIKTGAAALAGIGTLFFGTIFEIAKKYK